MYSIVRLVLLLMLSVPALAQRHVVGLGFPGENTAELDARLGASLTQYHPQVLVVFAGGNDALNEKKFLRAEQTGDHLASMIRQGVHAGAKVVVVTVHDPDLKRLMQRHTAEAYGAEPPLERLAQVNKTIVKTAAHEGATVIDFHDRLKRAGGATDEWSTDGVHLTKKGYGLLAETVFSGLPKDLAPNATVLCFGDSLTYGIGVRASGAAETSDTYPQQLQSLLH